MGFFDSIGDFFKDDVWGKVVKPVVEPIADLVKPVASDVYSGIGKPLINTTGGLINTGGRLIDKTTDNFLNLQSFVTNPIFLIGVGIVAIVLVPKILEKV